MKYIVEPIRDKDKIKAVENYLEQKNIAFKFFGLHI